MKKFTKLFAAALALSVGVCTTLGGTVSTSAAECKHTFSSAWESDKTNHWHSATCGDDIVRDIAPHTFSNGRCTVCGETQPETVAVHKHTYETGWTKDEVNHWHAADCGDRIVRDMAPHTYEGGKCTVCGQAEPVAHTHNYSSAWGYDEMYHWHAATCHDVVKDMAVHTLRLDGTCICGYSEDVSATFKAAGGYNESMYAEWTTDSIEGVTASYKASGQSNWTEVDSELIRISDGTARVDVVGIKAGTYSLKVTDGGGELRKDNISVSAYDRSGYAHFNYSSGVGAYDDNGEPKANAKIIYVSEENKNTVKATVGGKEYKGIVAILEAVPKSNEPVIIRVLGTVGAAAWNAKSYKSIPGVYDSSTKKYNVMADDVINNTPGTNGAKLKKQKYTMKELIDGGFNTLDESVYTELEGLSEISSMNYSYEEKDGEVTKDEFDSNWNNCGIGTSAKDGEHAENVTIEGIGNDAKIAQWGFTFKYAESVEVRNLTFDDYTEDACSFEGNTNATSEDGFDSNRIWLHHNTFYEGFNAWDVCNEQDKGDGDGSTDFKKCAYVTIAYNHYIETHKTGLIGGSDSQTTASVTFHHNFYDRCQSRLPLSRQANMHMYNNYYYLTSNTCVDVRAGGFAFVEYCYFDNAKNPALAKSGSGRQAVVKIYNCAFENGTNLAETDYVKKVSSRTDTVTLADGVKGCQFGDNFDIDPAKFYFDQAAGQSKVTDLIKDVSTIPVEIPKLAGANK